MREHPAAVLERALESLKAMTQEELIEFMERAGVMDCVRACEEYDKENPIKEKNATRY